MTKLNKMQDKNQAVIKSLDVKELVNLESIKKEKLLINTFSEKSSILKEFDIVTIKLKGIRDFIIETACIPSVSTPLSNQQCNKVVNVFPHFRNLKFADNINEQNKKIDLLIGADYYHKFFTDEIIRGKEGEPVAQNTFFGWLLSGNISTFDSKSPSFLTSMQINTSPFKH